jgi:hypothetical protein
MSGTRLDWISFGLADSLNHTLRQLIWWCNDLARSKGLQPCQAGHFQPYSFSNSRVIMSDQSRAKEFVSADTAIDSCSYQVGSSYYYLMWWQSTGHSPTKGKGPGLSTGVIEGLWHWLMKWGLLHPRILVYVGMATARVLGSDIKYACHLIYIGIVVVVRHVNLWCHHTTVVIDLKASVRYVGSVPDYRTIRVLDVRVEVRAWYMISCGCGLILISGVTH